MMNTARTSNSQRMDTLHEELLRLRLKGFWQLRRPMIGEPEPWVWPWRDVYPVIKEAGEVIPMEMAFRRNIGTLLPAPEHSLVTVTMGFQIVMPGESALVHRHTPSAMRFVVQGRGAYTTSDEEQMIMEPRDLITQPNWTWHGHVNHTNDPIVWIDTLDVPLIRALSADIFDEWPEGVQEQVRKPDAYARERFGFVRRLSRTPQTSAEGGRSAHLTPTPFRYPWEDTLRALNALAAAEEDDSYDGVIMEYTNPKNAGHTMTSLSARIQMLRPGQETQFHRHSGTTRYFVAGGQGATVTRRDVPNSEKTVEWEEGDMLYVPPWFWHQHVNRSSTEPAFLFSVCDHPLLEHLGIYREEGA